MFVCSFSSAQVLVWHHNILQKMIYPATTWQWFCLLLFNICMNKIYQGNREIQSLLKHTQTHVHFAAEFLIHEGLIPFSSCLSLTELCQHYAFAVANLQGEMRLHHTKTGAWNHSKNMNKNNTYNDFFLEPICTVTVSETVYLTSAHFGYANVFHTVEWTLVWGTCEWN